VLDVNATRPDANEYAPYYGKYISLVPEGDVVVTLSRQLDETLALLRGLSVAQADARYAPDKWSIKEVVGHIIDTERIFGHRVFRFARNDQTPLPGFEQDDYVRAADFSNRQLDDLAAEFEHVRRANLYLLRSLDDAAWLRRGVASSNEVSVRALAYIIAGHERHHMHIVRTRYLQ
jgi:uncharacterized damage-inducible protein DinB